MQKDSHRPAQVGTIMMNRWAHMIGNGREEVESFLHCGEKRNWRKEGSEEEADMGDLHCHLGPCAIRV